MYVRYTKPVHSRLIPVSYYSHRCYRRSGDLARHNCLVLQAERGHHPAAKETTMTSEVNPHATQEPLDDEERELMDPESWDWESTAPGRTVGTPFAQLCVRFSPKSCTHLWSWPAKPA